MSATHVKVTDDATTLAKLIPTSMPLRDGVRHIVTFHDSLASLSSTRVEKNGKDMERYGKLWQDSKVASTRVGSSLRIALISTPVITVPPENYGGLELIVASLARELAQLGHDVTIFAPEGSRVEGCRVIETGAPNQSSVFMDWGLAEEAMFDQIKAEVMTGGYDIIHGHNWFGNEYRAKVLDPSLHVLHTHHGGILAGWWKLAKLNNVAISDWMKGVYEQKGIPSRTIYNGVDLDAFPMKNQKSDRYLWFSRMGFFKAPHKAIEIAKQTGINLDVAGTTRFADDARYIEQLKKDCDGRQIRFIGEVSQKEKVELMQNAKALIVTAKWGEPFGLHVLESMATGTGVIAIADGALKETVKAGGVLCEDVYELAETVKVYEPITPSVCRWNASLFGTGAMARNYEKAYKEILSGDEW